MRTAIEAGATSATKSAVKARAAVPASEMRTAGVAKSAVKAGAAVAAEVVAGPGNAGPAREVQAAAPMRSVDPFAALRKRVALLFGFAYLLLFALASGLSVYMPLSADGRNEDAEDEGDTSERPTLHGTPPQTDYRPRPHPHPDPHTPGLHIRPDGSRYLIVPLNFAGAAA
ncbi:hypothetical protein AB0B28_02835 [Glycomyces sp. NPDC046736]|uniref:hypothetical protein n=1 Tax=Glycomyces sp. NPDC046736 TaxID=3155615 RepID=UPI0033E13F23